ncbi:TlpA family protein disulfide reductase [Actinoplanes hulinensis]|uniref:TlpA family protein disulfide reductase n=1 Tax=Actinoplanes hulinensis TaxID=1144547 RepID=A0ABS7BFR0_9ACTN|nr:TlpA disulfide reductase family protein [Actinoplanes hulinensis]MBW6439714.1 TlpA family protein disulfide reductase [Actinoplanes hulinensis]
MTRRRASRVPRLVLIMLATALAATGCGTTPDASPAPATSSGPVTSSGPAATATAKAEAVAVPKSLSFTGTTLAGEKFDAAGLAGRPAILWFWAPWCATCASEAQSLGDIHSEYGDELAILGIAGMGGAAEMKEFVADFELESITHLNDPGGKLWKRFGIAQQSWYVMVDRTGKIVYRGYLDDLQLTGKVRELTA